MADYRKASRGDSPFKSPAFNAAWQNDVTDMLAWFRRAKASGEVLGAGGSLESSSGVVRVKNLTTADQLRGNYVQLGAYLLDDVSQHKHWYEGNLYDAAENGKVAILERAVKSDDTSMVRARILGKCTARVNVTDVDHRFAVPVDGESVFDSASSGDIEILGAIDGTGEQELPVLLGAGGGGGSVNLKFGVLTSALSAAEALGTPGEGTVQEKDLATGDDIGGERTIKNSMFTGVLDNYAVWFLEKDGVLWLVKPDCTEAP